MSQPRTLILRSAGTNCDLETAHAFELAGATAERVHINELLADPRRLQTYQILAFPGGFSYGDDIAAGKILANQLMHHLRDALQEFVAAGKPVIGICNGFQVLVKTDLLPGRIVEGQRQSCTLAHNDSGRFVDRWVKLAARPSRCIWTESLHAGDKVIELPIAHGEGKFITAGDQVLQSLRNNGQIALVYAAEGGRLDTGDWSANPNGSVDNIAGVCDATGLVFGLMPHPERFVDPVQHPAWTSRRIEAGDGLQIFQNAVRHVNQAVGAGF